MQISKGVLALSAVAAALVIAGAGCGRSAKVAQPIIPYRITSTTVLDQAQVAQQTLTTFFDLLASQKYAEAVTLFDGDWESVLIFSENKKKNADNFKQYCEATGSCLKIKQVLSIHEISTDEYMFVVQFAKSDGSTYSYGPFGGVEPSAENPSRTEFEFTVKKINGSWKVVTAPLYVP